MIDESKLRELIAKWRGHWAVIKEEHTEIAGAAIGVTIALCSRELEALLHQSSTVGYCHKDGRKFMPQDVFADWAKQHPEEAKEWRAVIWENDQSRADTNP